MRAVRSEAPGIAPTSSWRILVVEDTPEFRLLITAPLRDQGFDVETAEDGASAVELARSLRPEVIVRFVTLANTGTLPAEAVLSTTGLGGSERSLDDVLALTVRGEDGEHLYRGKLSGLALVGGRLEPGQSRTYQLAISWPPTAHDNDYQGLPLTFGLQAHATPAAE